MHIQYIVTINSKLKFLHVMNCISTVSRSLWLILLRPRYTMFSFNCKLYFFIRTFTKTTQTKRRCTYATLRSCTTFTLGLRTMWRLGWPSSCTPSCCSGRTESGRRSSTTWPSLSGRGKKGSTYRSWTASTRARSEREQ